MIFSISFRRRMWESMTYGLMLRCVSETKTLRTLKLWKPWIKSKQFVKRCIACCGKMCPTRSYHRGSSLQGLLVGYWFTFVVSLELKLLNLSTKASDIHFRWKLRLKCRMKNTYNMHACLLNSAFALWVYVKAWIYK